MSKISQFKIRKPKNSKTSQNVLFEKPTKICQKKNSLGFTMKWNSKKAHSKLTHINQHEKTNCQKKRKKEKTQQRKKLKLKTLTTNNKNHIPNFPKLRERERERERKRESFCCTFVCLLDFFALFLASTMHVLFTATINFTVSFKKQKKNARAEKKFSQEECFFLLLL